MPIHSHYFFGVILSSKYATFGHHIRGVVGGGRLGAVSGGGGGPALPVDVDRYLRLVQEGRLYDHLSANSSIPRREFKALLFRDVFFGHNSTRTDLTLAFERQFPTVYRDIRAYKDHNYRRLAWQMQRAESDLMINGVCRTLMHEHPEIVFLTIHDSVLTSPDHVEAVKAVILAEFEKLGLRPTIRVESC